MTFLNRAVWLLAACLSLPASAAPWYRVEMMMIAYENEADIDQEQWLQALPAVMDDEASFPDFRWWQAPEMYKNLHSALWAGYAFARSPKSELPAPFEPLPNLRLQAEAERINERKDMKVVWHQAWIEPIQEADSGVQHPVNIRLLDRFDIQITGSFELHRSRYLHLGTDLIVQHYQPLAAEPLQALTLPESDTRNDLRTDLLAQSNIEASIAEPVPTPVRAAEVKQTRRMRSGELHYLDHPMLGIVIRAIPIDDASSL
ncbi:CsiV family protein [Thalassolituus sp. LLYu03]|uniref:CsiV family protein n=1 Tax=Thalassolituus sp. LLYu03 TaxID=3421656 RepID=UPI003D2AFBCF